MKQEKSKVIKKFDKINPSQLLLAIVIFYWMSLYTYPSLLTPYLSEIGATLTQAGLIVGSYGFTQMILRFPLGVYADHIGKKKI
ncbi:MAG: MFS transporter, partial [Clostridiaceae bacterium]|nr:MFS transporter [Clostridiaceae bacterium]